MSLFPNQGLITTHDQIPTRYLLLSLISSFSLPRVPTIATPATELTNTWPNVQPNSIIGMDNVPYHSVEINHEIQNQRKLIQNWLKMSNTSFEESILKMELLRLVKRYKPEKHLVAQWFVFPLIIVD